jgi:O-antigen polymerase
MNPIFAYDYFYPFLIFFVMIYLVAKARINKVALPESINFSISILDILIFLFALVISISMTISYGFFKIQNFYTLFTGLALYIFIKFLLTAYSHEYVLRGIGLTLLLLSGFEILIGSLQFFGVLTSNSVFYRVTGSFNSPTDYSNFLGSTLGFFIFYPFFTKKTLSTRLSFFYRLVIISLSLAAIICFTQSRMAWIACIAVLIISIWYSSNTVNSAKIKQLTKNYYLWGLLIAIITIFSIYLLKIKQGSTSGRMFVMMNELSILKSNFIYGIGFGNFNQYYNHYQSLYFQNHPNSRYEIFASYINVGYSEYLQLLVEGGFISLLLIILVLIRTLKIGRIIKNSSDTIKAYFLSFLSILILAIFSFPFRSISTFTNFIIYLSIIASFDQELISIKLKIKVARAISLSATLVVFILFGRIYKTYNALTLWQTMMNYNEHQPLDKNTIAETYKHTFFELNTDEGYLQAYASYLSKNNKIRESTEVLNLATVYSGYYMLHVALGHNYFKLNNYKEAEKHFLSAAYMVPNRFIPKKFLMAFYITTGNKENAKFWAENIVAYKIKVPSKEVNLIKQSAKKFLSDSTNPIKQ